MIKRAQNVTNTGLHEIISDHFSSNMAADEKEDRITAAVNEKDDGCVLEVVALFHCHRLEEGVLLLNESTLELLQCNELDRAVVTALDEPGTDGG